MTQVAVALHLEAVVEVDGDPLPFRMQLQRALDAVTEPVLAAGGEITGTPVLEATVRAVRAGEGESE